MAKGLHRQGRLRELVQAMRELAALEQAQQAALKRFATDYAAKVKAVERAASRWEAISGETVFFDFRDLEDMIYVGELGQDAKSWMSDAEELTRQHGKVQS